MSFSDHLLPRLNKSLISASDSGAVGGRVIRRFVELVVVGCTGFSTVPSLCYWVDCWFRVHLQIMSYSLVSLSWIVGVFGEGVGRIVGVGVGTGAGVGNTIYC